MFLAVMCVCRWKNTILETPTLPSHQLMCIICSKRKIGLVEACNTDQLSSQVLTAKLELLKAKQQR